MTAFPETPEPTPTAEYADLTPLQARITAHRLFSELPDDPDGAVRSALNLPSGQDLLDVGCGTGEFLHTLSRARHGGRLIGIDTSSESVQATRSVSNIEALRASATELPFDDGTFDCVTARHMLYHVDDPAQALSEAQRVLGISGRFAATVNHKEVAPRTMDLVRGVVHEAGLATDTNLTNDIHSETLPALVHEVFSNASVRRFDNALIFPSATALAAYAVALLSFCGVAPESSVRGQLAGEVSERCRRWFADHQGANWRDEKGYILCTATGQSTSH
ncbi:class I SAM-dependent methyltransferase [Streptomyces parvulus]|uniref:class I SAM-dependent methyltransferase n=1 Tax=Streptomyces parvulus TaxID=146923 RepID=UPI0038006D04